MTSIVHFTALSGSLTERPLCYLLRVDDALLLLDCGWDDRFNPADLELLATHAKKASAVLLSHPDIPHLGAYPYAFATLGLTAPAYATLPVQNMGRMALQDAVLSKMQEEPFSLFSPSDINDAFDHIHPLRYSQPVALQGNAHSISITAYAAGHSIGGTIWKIHKDSDEIVYAVDFNHRRELTLNGTALHSNGSILDPLHRPTLLITNAISALSAPAPRKDRHAALYASLTATLSQGGSALLPIDASARVLELTYLLEQHWSLHRLPYPIILLSNTAYRTLHYAKSMLEWMGEGITEQFATARENPFEFKHIRLCHSVDDLDNITGPCVVLATGTSLESGPSRRLLPRWAADPTNIIILTQRSFPSSLSSDLLSRWETASGQPLLNGLGPAVHLDPASPSYLTLKTRAPLTGQELEDFLRNEAQEKSKALEEQEELHRQRSLHDMAIDMDIGDSDDDEPDSDPEVEADAPTSRLPASDPTHPLHLQYDIYVRQPAMPSLPITRRRPRTFPFQETRRRFDEYGEFITPEDYMKESDIKEAAALAKAAFGLDSGLDATLPGDPSALALPAKLNDPLISLGIPDGPVKYLIDPDVPISWACSLQYIAMDGLVDGRSLRMILPQVNPRRLILVQGSPEQTAHLSSSLLSVTTFTRDIYSPEEGQDLNVSSATNIYKVALSDPLISSLSFKPMGEYALARVRGRIAREEAQPDGPLSLNLLSEEPIPSEDQAPKEQARPSALVGEVRLADLKRLLLSAGIRADFRGDGVLVAPQGILIRKRPAGEVALEGSYGDVYFKVRKLLYSQFAIV